MYTQVSLDYFDTEDNVKMELLLGKLWSYKESLFPVVSNLWMFMDVDVYLRWTSGMF